MTKNDRAPAHHVEVAVSFSHPRCLVLAGWVMCTENLAELLVLSTSGDWKGHPLAACRWHHRNDVQVEPGHGGLPAGFCGLLELPAEVLPGPLYLAFRMRDGRQFVGVLLEPQPFASSLRHHLQNLFAEHRGLARPELVQPAMERFELLGVAAAPPREFSESAAMWVDRTVALPDATAVLLGWCFAEHEFASLEVVDAVGRSVANVLQEAVFYPRPDVTAMVRGRRNTDGDLGFMVRIEAGPWELPIRLVGWTNDGKAYGVDVPELERADAVALARRLVSVVPAVLQNERDLMSRCLGPALRVLKADPGRSNPGFREHAYGTPKVPAEVTIVVAADDNPDWLRYQLAVLAGASECLPFDLCYVVNDPGSMTTLVPMAEDVHAHFCTSFRLLATVEPVSKPRALNAAIRAAQTDLVLLLGGKVLPRTPSFVLELCAALRRLDDARAVGALRASADGTIELPADCAGDAVAFPFGLHIPECLVDASEPMSTTELSARCLLSRRDWLLDVGGLASEYWHPRAADRDLSERLVRGGGRLYLVPSVVVDQLDALTKNVPAGTERQRLEGYDAWLLDRRRSELATW
jgi:hypothetical protein